MCASVNVTPHTEWCPDPLCFSISEPLFHGYETDHEATAINDILILLHLGMWPSVCMLHSHMVWFWSDRNLIFLSIIYPKTCLFSLSLSFSLSDSMIIPCHHQRWYKQCLLEHWAVERSLPAWNLPSTQALHCLSTHRSTHHYTHQHIIPQHVNTQSTLQHTTHKPTG